MKMFEQYKQKSKQETKFIFGGRLAEYKYYDMHAVMGAAMITAGKELEGKKELALTT